MFLETTGSRPIGNPSQKMLQMLQLYNSSKDNWTSSLAGGGENKKKQTKKNLLMVTKYTETTSSSGNPWAKNSSKLEEDYRVV